MKRLLAGTLAAAFALGLTACGQQEECDAKPVIYLYPEQETTVSVLLDYAGTLTATYPAYEDGWRVTAEPDGTLHDENGNEYSYLFWEGENKTDYDFSTGFCVAGADTADFLRETLSGVGSISSLAASVYASDWNEIRLYGLSCIFGSPYTINSVYSREVRPISDSVSRRKSAVSAPATQKPVEKS